MDKGEVPAGLSEGRLCLFLCAVMPAMSNRGFVKHTLIHNHKYT